MAIKEDAFALKAPVCGHEIRGIKKVRPARHARLVGRLCPFSLVKTANGFNPETL
jgi:hypothetical protein